MNKLLLVTLLTLNLSAIMSFDTAAQNPKIDPAKSVALADSLFWKGYNSCDLQLQASLIADDIEFYHDKGGITRGKDDMISSIEKNLCGPDFRLRRHAIASTQGLHLLKSADTVYGALITGEHEFYIIPTGKPERLDGHASFANLWLLKEGQWKLARVFSYDHGPAKYVSKYKQTTLSVADVKKFTGAYSGKHSGLIIVKAKDDHLNLTIGQKSFLIYPESISVYFVKERDLTFSFEGEPGKTAKLTIREFGQVVEEAVFSAQ